MEKGNNGMLILGLIVVFAAIGYIAFFNKKEVDGIEVDGVIMSSKQDIIENVNKSSNLETSLVALSAADLTGTLKSVGPYTIFIPVNEAFNNLPEGMLEDLLRPERISSLTDLLTYHFIVGNYKAEELSDGMRLATVNSQQLSFSKIGADLFVNDAKVLHPNIESKNGTIFIIDSVLVPDSGITVGGGIMTRDSSIVENLMKANNLTIFTSMIESEGLQAELNTSGPYTIFVPVDSAFASLTLSKDAMKDFLNSHILSGKYLSQDFTNGTKFVTEQGQELSFIVDDQNILVNNSTILFKDIISSNGVIYIVDKAL